MQNRWTASLQFAVFFALCITQVIGIFLVSSRHQLVLAIGAILTLACFVVAITSPAEWSRKYLPPLLAALTPTLYFGISVFFMVYWALVALRGPQGTPGQARQFNDINAYFEKIRGNEAELTAFFSGMPKGGDLHTHLTGAVYAELMLGYAIRNKMWVNTLTLKIASTKPKPPRPPKKPEPGEYLRIDSLSEQRGFDDLKQRLFQDWSIKDYFDALQPADKHFFDAFGKFPPADSLTDELEQIRELKDRAKVENVQYLEVMIGGLSVAGKALSSGDEPLREAAGKGDTPMVNRLLHDLWKRDSADAAIGAGIYVARLRQEHQGLDEASFTMRFLASVRREAPPGEIFRKLMAAFAAANGDSLVVGVNLVSREDGDLAMKDYRLHMEMVRWLSLRFPKVRITLHAGELTLGSVPPEDLTWHIREALGVAGARRIGHGVDIAYETGADSLLDYMHRAKIAVEINLLSNEYILKVRDDRHPILLYAHHHVPIVLSTDDAGILRTNLTEQFVAAARRYPELTYDDFRTMVTNSIEFSFIQDPVLKDRLKKQLEYKIWAFEEGIKKN